MNIITNFLDYARTTLGMGTTHNGLRDLWEVLGYPQALTIKDFRDKYKRGDIATRIVDAYPNACWSNNPSIVEDEEEQDETVWEKSVHDLLDTLDFWKHVKKLDKLCNLGSYAVLYIGFEGGTDISVPVVKGSKPTFVKALAEDVAKIKTYINDPTNPRFGMPEMYTLTLRDNTTKDVHYTRVLHVAERTVDDDTCGMSILEFIWNKLIDLEKVSGGAAEMFWLGARGGLSLEADAEADLGSDEDKEKFKKNVEAYQHGLTRMIRTKGMEVKVLAPTIASPKDQFDIAISLIAGATGIPKRILLGNEAGQLASDQDENNWNNQIKDRRINFCEKLVLNTFIDYMIFLESIKPLPKEVKYKWEWPSLVTLSEKDKAEIASKKSAALVGYANSLAADTIVPPEQFVVEILDMKYRQDEIKKMIEEENTQIDRSLALQQPDPNADPNAKPDNKKP